ncbi:unnamed protein product, partial [Closterium sp. NIES-65]
VERASGLKEQLRASVHTDLAKRMAGCRDFASVLDKIGIKVDGMPQPSTQQVEASFKKALLRYHPDRMARLGAGADVRKQVEAEETFKMMLEKKKTLPLVAPPPAPPAAAPAYPDFGLPKYHKFGRRRYYY